MTEPTGPEAAWRSALADGRLLLQKSESDGHYVFPPRTMAPGSGADDLQWVEASGGGTVYSLTVISPKPPREPYNVALIDLDEGVRVMSRVEGMAAAEVAIGMRVKARIGEEDGSAILLFDPA